MGKTQRNRTKDWECAGNGRLCVEEAVKSEWAPAVNAKAIVRVRRKRWVRSGWRWWEDKKLC
jgi:hypothetical protein